MKTDDQPESNLDSDRVILEKLRQLSLKEKIMRQDRHNHQHQALAMASQYQLNYRPMPKGIRLRVWEEGWKYRNIRKKSGFKHTKLEWKLPSQPGNHSSSCSTIEGSTSSIKSDLESLNLPPTKLEKKRQRLQRMYHRKMGGKESTITRPHTSYHEQRTDPNEGLEVIRRASMIQGSSQISLNSYDRNKQKNLKSQIVMPSYTPSVTSSRISSPNRRIEKEVSNEDGLKKHSNSKDKKKHRKSKPEVESTNAWSSKSTKGTDETPVLESSEKSDGSSKNSPQVPQEKKSARKSSAKSSHE